ncbi:hypothetical protein ACWT_6139 [Actinoplanes sp. SE50]|nr:hypothetical protein ACPL_6271 [Actinoplanes sp. SE50/110]ATO85554.1 hypothetical protein ACWT_6139 [Actinoplanes sp. SE50]SLM02967.1 hypothetical protein ACSP50_6252 [Actinoplanes sp. SE50/110]
MPPPIRLPAGRRCLWCLAGGGCRGQRRERRGGRAVGAGADPVVLQGQGVRGDLPLPGGGPDWAGLGGGGQHQLRAGHAVVRVGAQGRYPAAGGGSAPHCYPPSVAYGTTTEVDLNQPARPLLDWPGTIGPAGPMRARIRIVSPGEAGCIDGVTTYTPAWRTAVTRNGWLLLYAGHHLWDPAEAAPTAASIGAAWQAGTLAAARLRTRRTPDPPDVLLTANGGPARTASVLTVVALLSLAIRDEVLPLDVRHPGGSAG